MSSYRFEDDDLDLRCICLDAEMQMANAGKDCIKKDPNAKDPCNLCNGESWCFLEPSTKGRKRDERV